jgi:hypothetical protein
LGGVRDRDRDNAVVLGPTRSSPDNDIPINQHTGRKELEFEGEETPSAKNNNARSVLPHEQVVDSSMVNEDRNMKRRLHLSATDEPRSIPPIPTSPPKEDVQSVDNERVHLASPTTIPHPVVLVPDSDISGSYSQSRSYTHSVSLTQPSISQHSIASQQQPQALSSHDDIPNLSYPKTPSLPPKQLQTSRRGVTHKQDFKPVDPECNQLDTDDEAAQRILTKTSHTPFQSDVGGIQVHHPEPVHSTHPDHDRMDHWKSEERNFMPASSHKTEINPGQKRTLAESETQISPGKRGDDIEPLAKRRKGSSSDEVVVEKVEHDAAAGKEPSFARSRAKAARKERATQVEMGGAGM